MLRTWQDALDYIYSRANWETRPPGTQPTFELDRIRRVLSALGEPHHRWPAVHVAGTNGKGSTCAMVASALQSAGYRVGLYTSPHLHTVRERIQVDGEPITERAVLDWLNAPRSTLDGEPGLTTFEALTALAFSAFASAGVDVAVIEVGLGGRLDTTNVVRPALTVITPIALDHMAVLGGTVRQIAEDKCGIIKRGVPVVSAPQPDDARRVVQRSAADQGAALTQVGRDVTWRMGAQSHAGQRLTVTVSGDGEGDGDGQRYELQLPSPGVYQGLNAATAVASLSVLASGGWRIGHEDVVRGISEARWPARFECLGEGREEPMVVLDGAHNAAGARALVESLDARFPDAGRHLILGLSRGKDMEALLDQLLTGMASVVTAASEHPRAVPAEELAETVRRLHPGVRPMRSPAAALEAALANAGPGDVVVAAGSLFLVADVREAWFQRAGLPLPPRDPPPPADRDNGPT